LNKDNFIELIKNPNAVSKEETNALDMILEDFPYFQTARVLHLKGLKNQNSFKYNTSLKTTAAYTANRTVLFDFITKNSLDFDKATSDEKDILNEIAVIDSKVVDHLYKSIVASEKENNSLKELQQLKNLDTLKNNLPKEEKPIVESKNIVAETLEEEIKQNKEVLEINKPITFKKEDAYSFDEWLQLSPIKPINRKVKVLENEDRVSQKTTIKEERKSIKTFINKDNSSNLIAEFIKNKPKIKPIKNQEKQDISLDSTMENTSLMTETLARVYLEQKKYKKAIAAFKILSLKYPKKSSFFADRIKAIKFLEKHKS